MNSVNLWKILKKDYEIIKNNGKEYIFPTKEVKIKNKGKIEYLEKNNEKVIIKYTDSKILNATIDHIFTDLKNRDFRADELDIGFSIYGGSDGKEI